MQERKTASRSSDVLHNGETSQLPKLLAELEWIYSAGKETSITFSASVAKPGLADAGKVYEKKKKVFDT